MEKQRSIYWLMIPVCMVAASPTIGAAIVYLMPQPSNVIAKKEIMKKPISEEAKQHLKDYTDFLLKNGYCDTDVYSEPPTAIDQYLILVNQKK